MLLEKLLRLLGLRPRPQAASTGTLPQAAPAAVFPRESAPPAAVTLWEEMIDGHSRIAGYRFTVRVLAGGGRPDPASRFRLLSDEAIGRLAQRRLAVMPIGIADWGSQDYRRLIAPGSIFLLLPPADGESELAWLAVANEIRAAGGKLAIGGTAAAIAGALDLADWLLLNFADYSLEAFEQAVAEFGRRYPGLGLMAENVRTWPEHRFCQARGIRYCLGQFSTQPDTEGSEERLGENRQVLMELIGLLRREADPAQLAEVAKRDPAVVMKMLAMANSPAMGLNSGVTSVEQAILVLGRSSLYRWLTIAMFQLGGSPRDETLLELALRRARLLEILGLERFSRAQADELFLVGLLSLMDCLLAKPIADVIGPMHLSDDVVRVLIEGDGPYRRYLLLAIALEKGRVAQVQELAGFLEIDGGALASASASAQRWVEDALARA